MYNKAGISDRADGYRLCISITGCTGAVVLSCRLCHGLQTLSRANVGADLMHSGFQKGVVSWTEDGVKGRCHG